MSAARAASPVALLAVWLACGPSAPCAAEPVAAAPRPELRRSAEVALLGGGLTLIAASELLDVTIRIVPPAGLDPAALRWSIDRDQVGRISARAVDASNVASAISFTYPVAVSLLRLPTGKRWSGTLDRSVVSLESWLLATGVTRLVKNSTDRARPYTYVSASQRPAGDEFSVTRSEAFESMPSGHAATAFCGAAFAMTDHLLTQPQAAWPERVGIAYVGGLLAGTTSALRVRAGKHFPSDVLAGGAIGAASGIAMPLVHRYVTRTGARAAPPSRRAWLQAIGGLGAGAATGILVARGLD